MSDNVSTQYAVLVAAGEIRRDPAQEAVAHKLSVLEARLATHRLARKSSSLGWLFGKREPQAAIRGLYIHGDVGRGKTMLMDMFFATCPVKRKRRAHFHEFMADVHERLRDFRHRLKYGEIADEDPIRLTAAVIAQESWLLCFDEFHVTDIADAMILGRLFTRLFELDVVVVATSNVDPDDLYRDGLNRTLFLPFIDILKAHMEVVRLDARADFRLEKLSGMKWWQVPAARAAYAALDEAWRRLTFGHEGAEQDLIVKGHVIHVPKTAMGAARFTFEELCGRPLGAADYLRIAREYHTIVLDHVPVMTYETRNEAKRFIALIDTLYDNAVKLVASAEAEPDALYRANEGFEAREFKRTASRLVEMGSQAYLALPHGRRASAAATWTDKIVET